MTSTIRQLTYGECSDGELYIQEVDNPDIQVAYVLNYGDFNKTLALAQLFAAALDVTEALEAIMRYPKIREYVGSELGNKADAAIAKARGEK
jgi:hypothetical protein